MPRTSRIHSRRHKNTPPPAAKRAPPAAAPPAPAADAATQELKKRQRPERRTKPQANPDEGYVAVGRILAPFGLRGELKVQPLTDNPRRLAAKSRVYAGTQLVTITKSRDAQGYVYITLKGFHDRDSVERFRHEMLQVPESSLPQLEEGEYYRFQLIGLRVLTPAGDEIGTLEEIIETGANDVYRVRTPAGADILLPARSDVVLTIDLESHTMTVDPPDWR